MDFINYHGEIILYICYKLTFRDISTLRATCRTMNETITTKDSFWKNIFERDNPGYHKRFADKSWKENYLLTLNRITFFGKPQLGCTFNLGREMGVYNRFSRYPRVTSISCGNTHFSFVSNGKFYAYGRIDYGRLDGTQLKGLYEVDGLKNIQKISSSYEVIAIIADGHLFTIGSGLGDNQGQPNPFNPEVPKLVPDLNGVTDVSVGDELLALVANGKLYYHNIENDNTPRLIEVEGLDGVTKVACGIDHIAVIARDQLYTFGRGDLGALGHGDFEDLELPKRVKFFRGMKVTDVSCGTYFTVVIASASNSNSGRVYSFGDGEGFKLGIQNEERFNTPQEVSIIKDAVSVSCGGLNSGVTTDTNGTRKLYTFGSSDHGELGFGKEVKRLSIPTEVKIDGVYDVSCGEHHMAVLTNKYLSNK